MSAPTISRRLALAAALSAAVTRPASAQSNTTKLVVAFPPGGPVDLVARIFGEQLAKDLGHTVIIDNKPGANGMLAASEVMRSAPDGTTIWFTSVGAVAINPALYEKLNYDMTRDFAPVSKIVDNDEMFCVNVKDPSNTAADFVAASKERKESTVLGSSGVGSMPHLAIEQLMLSSGANLLHVPYKGMAPAMSDVIGGHIAGVFADVAGVVGFVKGGQLKPLGVGSKHRHPLFPEVKTLEEQGIKDIDTNNWYGAFVFSKTPPPVVAALNATIRKSLENPELKAKLIANGAEPAPSSPDELAALLAHDTKKWGDLIHARNIKIEQ